MEEKKWYDKEIKFGKKKTKSTEKKKKKLDKNPNVVEVNGAYHHLKPKSVLKTEAKRTEAVKAPTVDFSKYVIGFKQWYRYNTTAFWLIFAGFLLVCGLTYFFVAIYESPIKEGTVSYKIHDQEHMDYRHISDDVYRTEYYWTSETTTDSNGKSSTRQVQKSRQVFDYTRYCVKGFFDGEDFQITIEAPSKKHENKTLTNEIHVTKAVYEEYNKGDYFVYDKERDLWRDRNNNIDRVTNWSRTHINMDKWVAKEY